MNPEVSLQISRKKTLASTLSFIPSPPPPSSAAAAMTRDPSLMSQISVSAVVAAADTYQNIPAPAPPHAQSHQFFSLVSLGQPPQLQHSLISGVPTSAQSKNKLQKSPTLQVNSVRNSPFRNSAAGPYSEALITDSDNTSQLYLNPGHQGGGGFFLNESQMIRRQGTSKSFFEGEDEESGTFSPAVGKLAFIQGRSQQQQAQLSRGSGVMLTLRTNSEILDENSAGQHNINHHASSSNQQLLQLQQTQQRNLATSFSARKPQIIDCQHQCLSTLPTWVCDLKNSLIQVDLSFNRFAVFPDELCLFVYLRVLVMDYNQLRSLPEGIAFLKHLEEISFRHNFLAVLPRTLQNLSMLRRLDVSHNRLTSLSKEITGLHKLEQLCIEGNDFTRLPSKLAELKNSLRELSFDWFKYLHPPVIAAVVKDKKMIERALSGCSDARDGLTFRQFVEDVSSGRIGGGKSLWGEEECRLKVFQAAESEDIGVLRAMLDEFPEAINAVDAAGSGLTVIGAMLMSGKSNANLTRIMRVLMEFKAELKVCGGQLGSALHVAAGRLNVDVVEMICLRDASCVYTRDAEGNTALHIVMSIFTKDTYSARQIFKTLLDAGARPNARNTDSWTPLHIAVRKNQRAAVAEAMAWNAKEVQKENSSERENDNEGEDNREKSFFDSGYNGQAKSCCSTKLVPQQAATWKTPVKVNAVQSCLLDSCCQKSEDARQGSRWNISENVTVKEEEEEEKKKNKSSRFFDFDASGGPNKWTPIHIASSQGNVPMIELLSEANASPLIVTCHGQTPRRIALQSLLLFKLIRKHEIRWCGENIFKGSERGGYGDRGNGNIFVGGNIAVEERMNVNHLQGFIEQSMKLKESFFQHEQTENVMVEEEKEFGYSIKAFMDINSSERPRQREAERAAAATAFDDDDEIEDPEKEYCCDDRRLLPTLARNNGIARPKNGTVQTKEIEDEELNEDSESGFTNGIDEGIDEGDYCRNRREDNNPTGKAVTAVASVAVTNEEKIVVMDEDSSDECEIPAKEAFSSMNELEGVRRDGEIERLMEGIANTENVLGDRLWSLTVMRLLQTRLLESSAKFVCERGTLPRCVHVFNEYLLAKMTEKEEAQQLAKRIPLLLEENLDQLLQRIERENEVIQEGISSQRQQSQQLEYYRLNALARAQRVQMNIWQVIARIRDMLAGVHGGGGFVERLNGRCEKLFRWTAKEQVVEEDTLKPSWVSKSAELDNFQSMLFIRAVDSIRNGGGRMFRVIGSPRYFYKQQELQQVDFWRRQEEEMRVSRTQQIPNKVVVVLAKRQTPSLAVKKPSNYMTEVCDDEGSPRQQVSRKLFPSAEVIPVVVGGGGKDVIALWMSKTGEENITDEEDNDDVTRHSSAAADTYRCKSKAGSKGDHSMFLNRDDNQERERGGSNILQSRHSSWLAGRRAEGERGGGSDGSNNNGAKKKRNQTWQQPTELFINDL